VNNNFGLGQMRSLPRQRSEKVEEHVSQNDSPGNGTRRPERSDDPGTGAGASGTPRERALRDHPDFPFLSLDAPAEVAAWLERGGWLEAGELFRGCERAGEGNMNLTLRIRTSHRRFILKQARPWVEKYDHIEAPWDRALFEQRFYARVAGIPGVASRMPRLLGSDPDARVLLLEDLPGARDLSDLYSAVGEAEAAPLAPDELDELADYAACLHGGTAGEPDPELANRDMRALNHAHLFQVPLDPASGIELDGFEPGLGQGARALMNDAAYRRAVTELGERYLRDGRCLVHGDYFPGSWLRCDPGLRVIDPEFAFFGDPELDLGVAVGHLALASQPRRHARRLLERYAKTPDALPTDAGLVARYASVEVMRRLIGVAQLPLPPTQGFRGVLLERCRRALLTARLDVLFD